MRAILSFQPLHKLRLWQLASLVVAYDSVQLAAADILFNKSEQAVIFGSFDQRLNLVLCQFVFLEYKALALYCLTKLKLC
ncbi:hypothetical protein PN36_17940, partial [Candidatus Thiomargarita nelsonii]